MRVGYTPIHVSVLILGVLSTYSNCSDAHSLMLRFARYGTQFKMMILLNCSEASTRVFGSIMIKQKANLCIAKCSPSKGMGSACIYCAIAKCASPILHMIACDSAKNARVHLLLKNK